MRRRSDEQQSIKLTTKEDIALLVEEASEMFEETGCVPDRQAFIAQTGADELIVASQVFDHRARLRSYEIVAQAHAAGSAV